MGWSLSVFSIFRTWSERTSENRDERIEVIILISDEHLPISWGIPVRICFDCELPFKPTLLFLHHLHGDHILEVWVMRLKLVTYIFVRLWDPSRCAKIKTVNVKLNEKSKLTDSIMVVTLIVKMASTNFEYNLFLFGAHIWSKNYCGLSGWFRGRLPLWLLSLLSWHF